MNTKLLAESLNVSEKDILSVANMTMNSIKKDGMQDSFLNMNEKERAELAVAYAVAEIKRFSDFCLSHSLMRKKRPLLIVIWLTNLITVEERQHEQQKKYKVF